MKKWKSTLVVASATLGMFFAFGSSVSVKADDVNDAANTTAVQVQNTQTATEQTTSTSSDTATTASQATEATTAS